MESIFVNNNPCLQYQVNDESLSSFNDINRLLGESGQHSLESLRPDLQLHQSHQASEAWPDQPQPAHVTTIMNCFSTYHYQKRTLWHKKLVIDQDASQNYLDSVTASCLNHLQPSSYSSFLNDLVSLDHQHVSTLQNPSAGNFQNIPFHRSTVSSPSQLHLFRLKYSPLKTPAPLASLAYSKQLLNFQTFHPQAIPHVDHFQLRSLIVAPSMHNLFYTNAWRVMHLDPTQPVCSSSPPTCILDFDTLPTTSRDRLGLRVSALNFGHQAILLAGCFNGTYAYQLASHPDLGPVTGCIPRDRIINHISHCPSDANPIATLAVNDSQSTLAELDLTTNTLLSSQHLFLPSIQHDTQLAAPCYAPAEPIVNATAYSPCARLRIAVGDFPSAILLDARRPSYRLSPASTTPQTTSTTTTTPTHTLTAPHASPAGFATAWSPTGTLVAGSFESGATYVWDVRGRCSTPLATVRSHLGAVRSLAFRPDGAVLACAEAWDWVRLLGLGDLGHLDGGDDDWVHLRDLKDEDGVGGAGGARCSGLASTTEQEAFERQRLSMFGEIAGVAWDATGDELYVGIADPAVGGVGVWRSDRKTRHRFRYHFSGDDDDGYEDEEEEDSRNYSGRDDDTY